jgi:hypothetical protein
MSKVRIFNRIGREICQIENRMTRRSWLLCDCGTLSFGISRFHPKARREFLRWGNLVVVEEENLPRWGGFIVPTPSRDWQGDAFNVEAMSGEYLLRRRVAGEKGMSIEATPGDTFTWLVGKANLAEDLLLRVGEIHAGGSTKPEEIVPGGSFWDFLRSMQEGSGEEWLVTPEMDQDGNMTFTAGWYKSVGGASNYVLKEGVNLQAVQPMMREGGEWLINKTIGMGNCADEASRTKVVARDDGSIGEYGLWEGYISYDYNADQKITTNTITTNARTAQAKKNWQLRALDVGGTFGELRLGWTYPLQMFHAGYQGTTFEGRVRLMGIRRDESVARVLELLVEEVV